MKIQLAVLGSNDFLVFLKTILGTLSHGLPTDEFILHEYKYDRLEDIANVVCETRERIDAWIFSDQLAHDVATMQAVFQKSRVVSRDALALIRAIAPFEQESDGLADHFSIDNMSEEEVQDAIVALRFVKNVYRYQGRLEIASNAFEDLLSFHKVHYQEGRVKLCVTGNHLVFESLQRQKIPTLLLPYRETATSRMMISVVSEIKSEQFKHSQIAIQIVQVSNFNTLMDQDHVFYDIYRTYLKTQGLLLDYTEQVLGTFVSIGNGRFMIFSTRGIVEKQIDRAIHLLHQITGLTKLAANIGMGYGTTALEAEKNARLALNHAEKIAHDIGIYLVDEMGVIHGPLRESSGRKMKFRTDDKELSDKLHHAKINIVTYDRMLSTQEASAQKYITASSVSEILGMSERNARKILSSLHHSELAEVIGQETPTAKGRPRKIYRIKHGWV